jgi:hypothetical protein
MQLRCWWGAELTLPDDSVDENIFGGGNDDEGPSPPSSLLSSHPARLDARCKGLIEQATGGGRGYDNIDYNDHDRGMQARKHCKGEDAARELINVALSIIDDNTRA